ncbi:MAG: DegT/DnrJ/EryC1/StrS family aminotransferase, partial [Cytophagales bacterium]|nr:DegT/DnrJ/EryC1/StrS family aminotransferase [Cytophagales bacterium]
YDKAFAGLPIKLPRRSPSAFHALHLYVILTSRRKELYDYLKEKNIFTQVHYIPLHYMPYYKQLGFKKGDFPVAERYYDQCLSLPMYPSMTQQEMDYVISCVNQFYR